ncbi:S41 family peptidase [Nannocystis radixulma]|uniref:S41 family peptidase n=1 Tax=Nannocystis radixulma TaxID=2995305 RepID=A0ABT5BGT3_9BACT|nr:S41 family peptidase [Nannocystis radixulma]MDC0672247.1 S41 family peptidase [Nannocystis radixulma]
MQFTPRPGSVHALVALFLAACSSSLASTPNVDDFFEEATPLHGSLHRLEGSLEGSSSELHGSCADSSGREHVYRVTVPADGIVRLALRSSAPLLHVRGDLHEPATELACAAEVDALTRSAEVYLGVHAGDTFYVVVDTLEDAEPEFRLDLEMRPAFPAFAPLSGVYGSRGYGLVLGVAADEFAVFEVSSLHCIPAFAGPPAELARIVEALAPGPEPGTLVVTPRWAAGTIVFDALDEVPPLCADGGTPTIESASYERDALAIFDVFVATFREHYAFFTARGVDWEAQAAAARGELARGSSDADLWAVLTGLAAPLADGHVSLESPLAVFESKPQEIATALAAEHAELGGPESERADYVHEQQKRFLAVTDATLLTPPVTYERLLVHGRVAPDVGYLRARHFVVPKVELPLYLAAIDAALAELADTDRIVLDLRLNGGGSDLAAIALASRFVSERRVFATKRARAGDGLAPENELVVESAGAGYAGDVLVLTGGSTASAGEIFVLALRGLPHVTVVGWPTSGEFSDILERRLPNGWSFGLSNEIYRAADGMVYEALGIPPDVALAGDPYPRADRIDGIDRVLLQAAAL